MGVDVIQPRRSGIVARPVEAWRYRRFVPYFGRVFVQKRYQRTLLGWLWLPLRPAVGIASRVTVFGGLLGVATGHVPYLLYFVVAQGAWQLFAESAYWATRSLELSRSTLRRVYVPRLVPLISSSVPSLAEFAVYIGMALSIAGYYIVRDGALYLKFGANTLLLIPGVLMILLSGISIGLWMSAYGAKARDVRFGLSYVLSFWYFLTPVIYPIRAIPTPYRPFANLNPMLEPVELVKRGLLNTGQVGAHALAYSLAVIAAVFMSGLWFFSRVEAASLDGA